MRWGSGGGANGRAGRAEGTHWPAKMSAESAGDATIREAVMAFGMVYTRVCSLSSLFAAVAAPLQHGAAVRRNAKSRLLARMVSMLLQVALWDG